MIITMYQVDAFSSEVFGGNPAAVCVLNEWLDDAVLQNIAAENNLAETAFIIKSESGYDLRWFTPAVEIDLCGHATLASAYVIFKFLEPELKYVAFQTMSGELEVAVNSTNSFAPASFQPFNNVLYRSFILGLSAVGAQQPWK